MAGFADKGGRFWTVRLDAKAIDRVRAATGIDLAPDTRPDVHLQAVGRAIESLGPATLVDVLYAACGSQAERRGLTRGQFGQSLHGYAADRAADAFVAAVIDTVPSGCRSLLRDAWAKIKTEDQTKR